MATNTVPVSSAAMPKTAHCRSTDCRTSLPSLDNALCRQMKPVGQGLFYFGTKAFDRPLPFGKNFSDPDTDARPVIRCNKCLQKLFENLLTGFRYGFHGRKSNIIVVAR